MKKTIVLLLAVMMAVAMAACAQKEQPPPAKVDGPRMVQVGGELYIDTGEHITLARCGVMDGEITETVGPNEVPEETAAPTSGRDTNTRSPGVTASMW